MSNILGNQLLRNRLSSMVDRDHLHHCLLFEGPSGIGKYLTAKWLAKRLFCERANAISNDSTFEHLDSTLPCLTCWHCNAVEIEDHPDLLRIGLDTTKKKKQISVQQARDLIGQVAIYPRLAKQRVVIIDQAQHMTETTSNALLKTFEEPPTETIFILIVPSSQKMLTTIRSRAQRIRFAPVSDDEIKDYLGSRGEPVRADVIAFAQGCPGKVFQLLEGEYEDWKLAVDLVFSWIRMPLIDMYEDCKEKLASFSSIQSHEKLDFQNRILDCIEIVLRDILLLKSNGDDEQVLLQEHLQTLEKWAPRLDYRTIADLGDIINQAREDQIINVSPRMQLENLVVQFKQALRVGYIA